MSIRQNRMGAFVLLLLFILKAGYTVYWSGDSVLSFRFIEQNLPVCPSEADHSFAAHTILSDILPPVSERSYQHQQPNYRHQHTEFQYSTAVIQIKLRQYIRYASAIMPSLESTHIIFPFHTYI